MNYEWDLEKARLNRKKHKVTFEQAVLAIEDPYNWSEFDIYHSTATEDRYIVIGSANGRILSVVAVDVDEYTTRIISARPADAQEKEDYYANRSLYI